MNVNISHPQLVRCEFNFGSMTLTQVLHTDEVKYWWTRRVNAAEQLPGELRGIFGTADAAIKAAVSAGVIQPE